MKTRPRLRPLVLLLLLGIILPVQVVQAQKAGALRLESLPLPSALSFVQDEQGFLWIGSNGEGLLRYDGSEAVNYSADPGDATALPDGTVNELLAHSNGTFWVGTDGGLSRFDPETGTFKTYRHDPDDPGSLSDNTVDYLLEDRQGMLWLGTQNGLNRFDPKTETFTRFMHRPGDPTSLSHGQVQALYEDRDGFIWVGTGDYMFAPYDALGGLNRFDPEAETFTRFMHRPGDPTSLPNNKVLAFYEHPSGAFWVGTGQGLYQMEREAGTFSKDGVPGEEGTLDRSAAIAFIHKDRGGDLWIGFHGVGVARYNHDTLALETHVADDEDNRFWKIYESNDGTLWLSRINAGPVKVVHSIDGVGHYLYDPETPGGVSDELVPALLEDQQGHLWIGTEADGLNRLDLTTGRFTYYRPGPETGRIGSGVVRVIYEDRAGILWIGLIQGNGGLYRWEPVRDRFIRYLPYPEDPGNSRNFITEIQEDHQGRLWVGTSSGLYRFILPSGETSLPAASPFTPYLPSSSIEEVYVDRAGTLWVTSNESLKRYDSETDTFISVPGPDGFRIHEDHARRFWVAGQGRLSLFDRETGERTLIGGLPPSDYVRSILEDDEGYLWIATGRTSSLVSTPSAGKLWRFDPEQRTLGRLMLSGDPSRIGFANKSAAKLHDGTLAFGGRNGVLRLDPRAASRFMDQFGAPRVVLTGLLLFNEPITRGPDAPLQVPIHQSQSFVLDHGQNDFTINYAVLEFRAPGQVQYRYRLVPHDKGWVDAGTDRRARYSGLGSGTYTFEVRAVNGVGIESEAATAIRVVIHPPWWRTWWAYMLYSIPLFGFGLGLIWVARRRAIQQERERSHRALQAAYTQLDASHRALKTTQAQLIQSEKMASLGQLTAGIAHEIKNPLNFINNFAEVNEELAQELREAVANGEDLGDLIDDLEQNARVINQHGKRADGIVHAMMQHASGGTGQREPTDINALVSEHIDLAYHGKRAQVLDLIVEIKRELGEGVGVVAMVPQEIGRVLLNLLGNAFDAVYEREDAEKRGHGNMERSYKPTVTVSTGRPADTVEIRVADNGPGIPAEIRDRIFEPFFTTKPTGSGTGLGLSLSYDIVTQGHGGTLTVESEEGEGATFIISLPA